MPEPANNQGVEFPMGVLLFGVPRVRVGWVEDGNDRDHERNDGLGSRQWTSAGLSMQILDPLPR